jgi:hypothetical protein
MDKNKTWVIRISKDTAHKLNILKAVQRKKNVDQVISDLISKEQIEVKL